ncbi:hypothetical protein DID88_003353 [Monilinia fructigena]|uniref:Helicase ATP-binding domain-containing protein n=1 Tax=Monilinia fructigena TaxID=38457 RepID=A0A395IDX1_9HELO|nr:hypothetical protein DID88_003353 [Monilinia fructigena]
MVRKFSGRLPPVGVDDASHQPEEEDAAEASASMNPVTTSTLLKKRNKQRGDDASKDWTEMFYDRGINTDLPPCDTTADFIVEFIEKLIEKGFSRVTDHLNGRPLIVATACSGTEAPIIFLSILSKALRKKGLNFKIVHVFSIEIEPWKQTYIRRNFPGVVILRDITEILCWTDHPEQKGLMTTAYGAKYALPAASEIDLLIAGTSCTSFSTLNSQRSTDLDNDENESSRTFRAYSKLVEYLKPKVAINENVVTGPFQAMMNMLNNHGCLTGWASFDSKYFGIPQTRQRGYLIAVNKSSLEQAGNPEEYSDWKTKFATMKTTFGRDASTSIEQWMEKSDSKLFGLRVNLVMRIIVMVSASEQEKPITDWRSTGVFRHPDHWVRGMKGFVERVHDYTDVSHLRGVVRGYDDRYIRQVQFYFVSYRGIKHSNHVSSRNNDLSQNVYVQHDNTKGGIMSCLTPHGAMFNTTRGSKITGDEALRLQGIDTASLDLDGLTQAELRNFAGNAMTTTVVGAVTAFALLTFYSIFDRGNDADISVEDATTMTFRDEETVLYSCEDVTVVQHPLTVGECVHLVESSEHVDCTWEIWLPKVQVVKAIVTCGGHLIPSYQNSVGIPDYKKDFVWSEMTIEIPENQEGLVQRVCGVYTARPECQQAFNSMHTKDDTIGSNQPLFLFFDHEASTGDWFKHGFIITDDPERKEWGVYRRVIARLDCSWEKPVARKLNDSYEFRDSIYDDITSLQKAMSEVIDLTFFGSWLLKETKCEVSLAAFSCKALTDVTPRHWQTDCWTKVTRQNGTDFYRDCYHLLARGLVEHGVIEDEVPWIPGSEQVNIGSRCRVCAPKKPTMLWYLKQIGAKRQQAPMEDPEQAADFERLIKAAPAGMEEWVKFTKVEDHYQFEYRCLINPSALGHKAAYLLDTFPRPDVPVILSWRFIRGASGNSISPIPLSFVYSSTNDLPMSDPPRRFRADKRLRNEQRKTLTWMVNQERCPPTFMEREVVETRQENLAFRLEGRACRMVKHRAGLLAAAVGYGKTVMTFALMSKQYLVDREWSGLPNLDGLIHTKSTLVLVPAHLTLQWKGEACAFLGYEMKDDPRILVLATCQQVKALTVQKIRDAELVICSSSQLGSEGYLKIVAKNAGVVDLARSSSDRAKEAWFINANEQRRDNLLYLQRNLPMAHDENNVEARKQAIDKFTEFMKEKYKKSFAESGANKPHIPSRRLKGAALTKDLEKKKNGVQGNKGKAKASTDEDDAEVSFVDPEFAIDCVLGLSSVSLQDFAWARVVTDEISYNVSNFIAVAIRELVAQSRWALSATPNITDHLSASRIARCLGINLGTDDQETIRKDKHLTSAERFLSYGPDASPSWHAARVQVAQEFCDMFVRQDKRPDTGKFNRVHCFIGMQMATPQLACYLTIKSDVTNKAYMMTRTTDTRSAVQEELQRTYGRELDGRLRLTKAASFFPEHSRKTIPYTLKSCKDLRAIALGEIAVAKDHVRRQIELIRFLLPLPQVIEDPDMATRYNNWRTQILAHHRYPDPDALQDLAQVIATVELAPLKEQHELYFTVPQAPLGRRLYPDVDIMLNGRRMDGLLADCRRVLLTELHKTAMALVHTRQEYRYFRAVVDIDQAGRSSPRGTLACNCCNLQSPLSEMMGFVQSNSAAEHHCTIKSTQRCLYIHQPGNFDSDNAVEISQTKAEVNKLPIYTENQQISDADWDFWSKPFVTVDKLSAIRKIFWEHDDAFNKFLVFSPLPEYLALAEAVITADGIPCVNLKGRKSDIARVLENFKNNRGMNYKEGPTRKRAPSKKATAAATAAPAQGPPVLKVTPPSEDSKKRKRDDSEDDTQSAPLPKSARVASPRQSQNDSDGPPDVSDSEGGTIRTSNLKRKRESSAPDDSESQSLTPEMTAKDSEGLNSQFSAQHSDGTVVELPEVPVLIDSANSDDYNISGGLGFAEDVDSEDSDSEHGGFEDGDSEGGGSEDYDSEDDNSKYHLVRDPVSMKPPTSAVPIAHKLPSLPSPLFVELPPVVYPPIHPSEIEVTNDIGDKAPMASTGAHHPDDTPVDWDRLGLEAEYEEYEEDLDPTARVLFLDIADESAAGSNLTVVQHVIFMTPYYAEKTRYNAAMTQAIGRAIRQGQEQGATVMIHHLLVKDTVEMDIAHELMDDDFPGKANAMPMLTKYKSDIGPAFFRK